VSAVAEVVLGDPVESGERAEAESQEEQQEDAMGAAILAAPRTLRSAGENKPPLRVFHSMKPLEDDASLIWT